MGLILKRRKKKLILVFSTLLVVFLCIGYAVLTSNLNVNGIFSFSKNEWNVYFDNIVLDENSFSKELPIISEDKSSVSFNAILSKPYDIYRFYIDVVNDSTLDAMIDSINLTGISDVNKKYIESSITYFDGSTLSVNDKLLKNARSIILLELKYKDINTEEIPVANIDLDVVFSINYRQDDGTSNLVSGSNSWTFDYKGSEDTLSIPVSGNYKLEVWGGQGGSTKQLTSEGGEFQGNPAGYGGYATGKINLNTEDLLYLNIASQGHFNTSVGYNGGGPGSGAGGGATHIATKSGLLSTLENSKDSILIVAGGGGGTEWGGTSIPSGGGYKGGHGSQSKFYAYIHKDNINPISGGQTSGGMGGTGYKPQDDTMYKAGDGSFGQGGSSYVYTQEDGSTITHSDRGPGGGGGFYGGGAAALTGQGAGGSGYIGNSLLTDKAMYCYRCEESIDESTKTISTINVSSTPISQYAKIGNGFARITYIG